MPLTDHPTRPTHSPAAARPPAPAPAPPGAPRALLRMDMHCHSRASSGPALAALGMIGCPECYSPPEKVYEQAMARGMDLATITDHDTIAGAMELHERGFQNFVVGEEVTVHFPEDRCTLHILVWGLTPERHEEIGTLRLRADVYRFAQWLAQHHLPHAVAHPLYIQNGRLTRWHIDRCILLFKGFETLNGAHSGTHRASLDRYLDALTPASVQALVHEHGISPLWPRTWLKARTGGSDDHGLLNIGRTWTAIPPTPVGDPPIDAPGGFLRRVMSGAAQPGGAAGDPSLLAHQLTTVAAHFLAGRFLGGAKPGRRYIAHKLLRFAGVHVPKPGRASLLLEAAGRKVASLMGRRRGVLPIVAALREAIGPLLERYPDLRSRLAQQAWTGGAALSEHAPMAGLADDLTDALTAALSSGALDAVRRKDPSGITDHVISYAILQAAQLPYIVSLFHQNKERPFLERFDAQTRGQAGSAPPRPMRVSLFTDTLGDVNGVCRFIQNVAERANETGRDLQVITSTRLRCPAWPNIHNFEPSFAMQIPKYENLDMVLPPLVRILRHIDRHQPDVIHISTPGPVGMVGLLAARMLRVPVLGVYHTDFPAYVDRLFDDHAFTYITQRLMRFFYSPFARVFTRSDDYKASVAGLGIDPARLRTLAPGVDTEMFHPRYADPGVWARLAPGADAVVRVLYVGRVSVEKNLPFLSRVWARTHARLSAAGVNAELVVVGDGPYRAAMEKELKGRGARFLGFRHAAELSAIYASSDLFVFPSTTDTLGQVVMESQASGLPVLVTDRGGPKEVVSEGKTGHILSADDSDAWTGAIEGLVVDRARRRAMGAAAHSAMQGLSIKRSFEHFWEAHEEVWRERPAGGAAAHSVPVAIGAA